MFPKAEKRETLTFKGNKINWFPLGRVDTSVSRLSLLVNIFEYSALLPSDVIDFSMLPAQKCLTRNSYIISCHMTLQYLATESMCCWRTNSGYILLNVDPVKNHHEQQPRSIRPLTMKNSLWVDHNGKLSNIPFIKNKDIFFL